MYVEVGLVLTPADCAWLKALLAPGLQEVRRTQQPLNDHAWSLIADIFRAAEHFTPSAGGSPEVPDEVEPSHCEVMDGLSTAETAQRLGVSSRAVRFALKAGRLEGRKRGGSWSVSGASVMAAIEQRRALSDS